MNISKLNIQENFLKGCKKGKHACDPFENKHGVKCNNQNCLNLAEVTVSNGETFERVCGDNDCFIVAVVRQWVNCPCSEFVD